MVPSCCRPSRDYRPLCRSVPTHTRAVKRECWFLPIPTNTVPPTHTRPPFAAAATSTRRVCLRACGAASPLADATSHDLHAVPALPPSSNVCHSLRHGPARSPLPSIPYATHCAPIASDAITLRPTLRPRRPSYATPPLSSRRGGE
ncbi:hypothetical protein B0H19DRAFT_1249276 [Mycena capillaripes]|nr:hypothetical protein B0H19DRAFT_1249276 [Mycena capillaripes]